MTKTKNGPPPVLDMYGEPVRRHKKIESAGKEAAAVTCKTCDGRGSLPGVVGGCPALATLRALLALGSARHPELAALQDEARAAVALAEGRKP